MPVPNASALMSRREFLKTSVAAAALTTVCGCAAAATPARLPTRAVILFQGDSITDAGRDRNRAKVPNDPAGLAAGYAGLVARGLLAQHPEWQCYNRGVSGNRVLDLLERWEQDSLELAPDLVSILIGVNDTWHRYIGGTGIPVARYQVLYTRVLADTVARRPSCRLVLCEPFALPGGAFKNEWMPELRERMAVVRRLARDFHATLVPFQEVFESEMKSRPASALAVDGVHPTELGHQVMAKAWRSAVGI